MPQKLQDLSINEVSLVDRPANSEKGVPRARVALFKRDTSEEDVAKDGKTEGGQVFPKGDYAYAPDDVPSHWKLRLTSSPGGSPDPHIVGAAIAALGKGFRGNKVEIPAEALHGVKAKVRAAWKAANPDKGSEELPEVLKSDSGENNTMTIAEIEAKITKQDENIAVLTKANDALKSENQMVLKMSGDERAAYASMDEDTRKSFCGADAATRKTMIEKAAAALREADLIEKMDDDTRVRFEKAGPNMRAAILEQIEKECTTTKDMMEKKKKAGKTPPAHNEPDGDEGSGGEGDGDGDEGDMEKAKKALITKLDVVDELTTRLAKAEKALADGEKQARLLKFTKRAETDLPHTPGAPEEKGEMLMKLADTFGDNSEQFNKMMGHLKEADKAHEARTVEIGKSGGSIPAEKVLFAKVEEIKKRDNIDQAHAMIKVMEESPDLYVAYEKGQRDLARAL